MLLRLKCGKNVNSTPASFCSSSGEFSVWDLVSNYSDCLQKTQAQTECFTFGFLTLKVLLLFFFFGLYFPLSCMPSKVQAQTAEM